jgi:hypothetical protein
LPPSDQYETTSAQWATAGWRKFCEDSCSRLIDAPVWVRRIESECTAPESDDNADDNCCNPLKAKQIIKHCAFEGVCSRRNGGRSAARVIEIRSINRPTSPQRFLRDETNFRFRAGRASYTNTLIWQYLVGVPLTFLLAFQKPQGYPLLLSLWHPPITRSLTNALPESRAGSKTPRDSPP